MKRRSFDLGIFFTLITFFMWGIFPLYWKLLANIDALHILAFRIVFSQLLVGLILIVNKDYAWITIFREPAKIGLLIFTALAISANWGIYIWAVNQGRTIEASLGYYINPLVSIMLGLIFFREKLKPLQWASFAISAIGVLILTALSGTVPWISLILALSFGIYGLLKKTITLSALESLGAETFAALPIGLFLLLFRFEWPTGGLPSLLTAWQDLSYLKALPPHIWLPLSVCGLVTALPLYCFACGVKLLPLSTLGFLQFVSPTLQFLMGYFIFGEYFPARYFIAFAFIWLAVILYIISLKPVKRNGRRFYKG
jgi:chloramphenicol-sensitive protein RarD